MAHQQCEWRRWCLHASTSGSCIWAGINSTCSLTSSPIQCNSWPQQLQVLVSISCSTSMRGSQLWRNPWTAWFSCGSFQFFSGRIHLGNFGIGCKLYVFKLLGFVKDLAVAFVSLTAWAKTLVLRKIQPFFKSLYPLGEFLVWVSNLAMRLSRSNNIRLRVSTSSGNSASVFFMTGILTTKREKCLE